MFGGFASSMRFSNNGVHREEKLNKVDLKASKSQYNFPLPFKKRCVYFPRNLAVFPSILSLTWRGTRICPPLPPNDFKVQPCVRPCSEHFYNYVFTS